MKTVDIVTSLVVLALSAVIFMATRDMPYWADFAPGSAFAPFWVAAAGAVLAVLLLASALRRDAGEPNDFPDRQGLLRVLSVAIALWLLVAFIPLVGFTTAAIAFCLYLLLRVERRRVLPSLFATAATVGLVHGVFVVWLGINLPQGVLGF